MNAWLIGAGALAVTLGPLALLAALRPAREGLVALQVAGTNTTLALLLIAEGTHRQPFGDLAVVLALLTLPGTATFARFLERPRPG